jgi:hypothetical protein
MPAPELTLRTSGITWRTEGYGGPDNDVRLTAAGELCVDVQRLARSTLVKISASDSPASSSASAAPNRFREAHVIRRSSRRGTTGRRTVWANVWPIVVGPRILAGPARSPGRSAQINACPHGGRGQKLPKYGGEDIPWGGCRPGRQVSADPYSGAMRRTNCGCQTRSWMTPSSRGAVVRRYFSSSGVAFASTQGTARRIWR